MAKPKLKIARFHCQACGHQFNEAYVEKYPCCTRCGADQVQKLEEEKDNDPSHQVGQDH